MTEDSRVSRSREKISMRIPVKILEYSNTRKTTRRGVVPGPGELLMSELKPTKN